MFDRASLEAAAAIIARVLPPTLQYAWPLLGARTGCEVWVKHENHLPTGAFKVRGGLVLFHTLRPPAGVISATRGNHGQSIALAGQRNGVPVTIVVPHGNSVEKNAAMRGFGAELIESGADFDAARGHAEELARARGMMMVPSFHPELVRGVATYAYELFTGGPAFDTVYVPIGLGSGICGTIMARDLLGLKTEIVGVVAAGADAYARSFEQNRLLPTDTANTMADGLAVRIPNPDALAIIKRGAARILRVSEPDITDAMRTLYETTHNVAEGAGAAALAGLYQERARQRGRRVAVILSGGNVDRDVYARVLSTLS